jgi:hypothetical protein
MREWFLVAGGPSLEGFDFDKLRNKYVIAINRSLEVLPHAHILYWTDWLFYKANADKIKAHRAVRKITALRRGDRDHDYDVKRDPIEIWKFTGADGLDRSPGCLRHGNNSGFAAINLAVHFGAQRIYLLGYDMRARPDGKMHWHSGHVFLRNGPRALDNMLPYFPSLIEPLRRLGIQVINLNPDSRIECFPKRPLLEVLP